MMELVVIICNQPERLNHVLELLAEEGVPGGTVIQSEGMAKLVSSDAPLLARYGHLFSGVRPHNCTILTVVSAQQAHSLLRALESRDEIARDCGVAFSLPLSEFVRLRPF
jgi:nitrogen regulatory protein PII